MPSKNGKILDDLILKIIDTPAKKKGLTLSKLKGNYVR